MKTIISKLTTSAWSLPLLLIAGLNMGNQSCNKPKAAAPPPRVLKMDTSVGVIQAKTITLPTGEVVDFPYVANALFYGQVMLNNHMSIATPLPSVAPASLSTAANTYTAEELKKVNTLRKYGLVSAEYVSKFPSLMNSEIQVASVEDSDLKCTYQTPEFSVAGQIEDFTGTAGGGFDFGFGNNPTSMGNIGVNYSKARLDMRLRLDRPLTQLPLEIGDARSYQKSVSAKLGYGMIGINFFFQTAMSDVIKEGMDAALSAIIDQYTKNRNSDWNTNWESRVVYCQQCDNDTHIAFRGGAQNGIKNGDKFKIFNLNYQWANGDASACKSRLISSIPDNPTIPTAYGTVEYVDDNFSVLRIDKYTGKSIIRVGARVSLDSFVVEAPTSTTPTK